MNYSLQQKRHSGPHIKFQSNENRLMTSSQSSTTKNGKQVGNDIVNKDSSKPKSIQTQLTKEIAYLMNIHNKRELTLVPKINLTKMPVGKDLNVPVHERLYSLTKEHPSKMKTEPSESAVPQEDHTKQKGQHLFYPRINSKSRSLKRKEPIALILYSDAKRRTEKGTRLSTESSISQQPLNNRSEQVYAASFIKMFQSAWHQACPLEGSRIDYLKMNQVLETLLFITQSSQIANATKVGNHNLAKERSLIYEIWGNLKGDKHHGVSKRNLCLFLMALQGIRNTGSLESMTPPQSQSLGDSLNTSALGDQIQKDDDKFKESLRLVSEKIRQDLPGESKRTEGLFQGENWFVGEDMNHIQVKYDLLVKNRLNQQRIRNVSPRIQIKEYEKQVQLQKEGKKPQYLGGKVIQIDLKKKTNPNEHVNLLVQQRSMQLKRHEEIKQMQKDKELDGCTFQPNPERCAERIHNTSNVGLNKSLTLYKMQFQPSSQKRDKSTHDIEYERQCDECTFVPDISLTQKNSKMFASRRRSQQNSTFLNKDVDKSVERMKMARQLSENTSLMFKRGYHDIPNNSMMSSISNISDKKKKQSFLSLSKTQAFRTFDDYGNTDSKLFMKSQASDAPHELVANGTGDNKFSSQPITEWNNQSGDWLSSHVQQHDMQLNDHSEKKEQQNALSSHSEDHMNSQIVPEQKGGEVERIPLLFVDVNIGKDRQERITIYTGDSAENLAKEFALSHNLDEKITKKLEDMLNAQMFEYLHRTEQSSAN